MPDKMTQQAIMDVALRVKDLLGKEGWSLRQIAEMVGVSRSTISLFLAGKYKGDSKGLAAKLHQLMESVARRKRKPHGEAFVETAVAKRIFTVIAETDAFSDEQEGKIGIIIGDGGHGKSHCLRRYAEVNKNTIYVELDDATTTTLMFSEIARKLGLDGSGSRAALKERLVENLQNRHLIVILDEASHLSVAKLNLLRQVIVIKARCPLILSGNRYLVNTVMQPTTRRGCESLDQFVSRLMCILDLDAKASDPGAGLYTGEDIRRLYEFGGLKLTGDAVATLRRIAKTPRSGRLRTCSHIIAACHRSTKVRKAGAIDTMYILSAIEQLSLPVKVWLPVHTDAAGEEAEQQEAVKAG